MSRPYLSIFDMYVVDMYVYDLMLYLNASVKSQELKTLIAYFVSKSSGG